MTVRSDAETEPRFPAWLVTGSEASWRILVLLLLGWVGLQLLGRMRLLAVSFLVSLVVTALLYPVARWMRAHRVPKSLAATLPLVLLVGVIVTVVGFFARGIAQQWDALVDAVVRGWEQIRALARATPGVDERAFPRELGEQLTSGPLAERAFQTVYTTAEIGTGMLLVLVFVFFLLRDGPRIGELLVRLFPRGNRDRARAAAYRGWHTLERYIVGISIVAAINTVLTGIALLVLRIPMAIPLVLFTFVACFVPFVGTILAISAGALIALAERGPKIALFFVLAGLVIELLESNVTQPLVQGRVLHVHPLLVVAFVTAGTVMFGLPGAFLAVPLLAVLYGVGKSLHDGERAEPEPEPPRPEPRVEAEQPA
jgi:predicted PurR-regulated permease PerM